MCLRKLFSAWNVVLLLALLTLFLLVVYPMYSIFQASLLDPDTGVFTWNNYASVFTTPFYRRCLGNSLFMPLMVCGESVATILIWLTRLARYRLGTVMPCKDFADHINL